MAEIRANREYKFKEFSISEEIPKSPPIKAKRWTFRDTNPSSRFYNRPAQRKWDEKDSGQLNGPSEPNINQQYIKPFKKPESDLRAEFFNAYKKYYRRVDIKRLEVQSTLNVDAKFKGADESLEGESSLYKEKECMEINIVMDTEKDDAMVSSKVRRTVLCASPGEEEPRGAESIRSEKLIIGGPEELAISDRNIIMGGTKMDESGYCSPQGRSNCLVRDLPVTSEQNCYSQPNHPRMEQGQCSMNRTILPFFKISQNSKNLEPKAEKNVFKNYEEASTFNNEHLSPFSCNDTRKTDLLANKPRNNVSFPLTQMTEGNGPTDRCIDELIHKDEKKGNVKTVERTFYNSKLKPKVEDSVYGVPFKSRNPEEKSSPTELFDNRKPKFKSSIGSEYINSEDLARRSIMDKDNFAPFDNSVPNLFNHDSISQNFEKSINIDSNTKIIDQRTSNSEPDEILIDRERLRKYRTNESVADDNDFDKEIVGTNNELEIYPNNTVHVFRIESTQESPRSKRLDETKHYIAPTLEDEYSNSIPGVRFRGLRGAVYNESNKNVLKSLVVNVMQSDCNYDKNVPKREFDSFSQNEQTNLAQRYKNKEDPNLERKGVHTCSQISSEKNPDFITASQISCCDPINSSYKKVELPAMFHNITHGSKIPTYTKNLCSEKRSFVTPKREDIEEPFVIWSNKNKTDPYESLNVDKLTVSVNESDLEPDYETNSDQQSFSDWGSIREISDNSKRNCKVNKQDYRNHSLTSENREEKTQFKNVPKSSHESEENKKVNGGKRMQFPEKRYSSMTSVPSDNFPFSHSRSQDVNSRVLDKFSKDNQKSQICYERVSVPFDENGRCTDERSGVFSQRHYSEESIGRRRSQHRSRQNIITNGCVVGDSQLTGRTAKVYDKNKSMDESCRIRKSQEEDLGKKILIKPVPDEYVVEQSKIDFYESNGCNKKISRSSSSDQLQIGPTYTVHYSPAHLNVLRKDEHKNYDGTSGREEIGERCHGEPVNPLHCSHETTTDCFHRKRNETLYRNGWGHSTSSCCDNYLNTCHDICHGYYKQNSDEKPCGYFSAGKNSCSDCEDLNRGFSHRMRKNNGVCPYHVRDTNLHCRNSYNCSISNKHIRNVGFLCHEGNRNCCQECGDEQKRFRFKECLANYQKPNDLHSSCSHCLTDLRTEAACTRIGKCCNSCSDEEQMNSFPLRLDHERQWMATGHQPVRNINKCPVDVILERSQESPASYISPNNDMKEQFMREFGNHCPVNSQYNVDPHYIQELSSVGNHKISNSYTYDDEVENEFQFKSVENGIIRNHSLKDITIAKNNPVNSERNNFNIASRVDHFADKDELKVHPAKQIPAKKTHGVLEKKKFSSKGESFGIKGGVNSGDRMINDSEGPLREADEPLFLCEEQWDTDDGLPMRRMVRKVDERKEENGESSDSENEPIYLREENWGSDDEETETDNFLTRDSCPKTVSCRNGITYLRKGQRSVDSQAAGRSENFSEGEESRICSSVHAVSDPSFQCEEQWVSDEEKCEDHKFQLTLPKNRMKKRKGRDRRSFNPRRWDMVTDLPRNEYIAIQNRKNMERNNYQCRNFGDSMVFQNSMYHSNTGQ